MRSRVQRRRGLTVTVKVRLVRSPVRGPLVTVRRADSRPQWDIPVRHRADGQDPGAPPGRRHRAGACRAEQRRATEHPRRRSDQPCAGDDLARAGTLSGGGAHPGNQTGVRGWLHDAEVDAVERRRDRPRLAVTSERTRESYVAVPQIAQAALAQLRGRHRRKRLDWHGRSASIFVAGEAHDIGTPTQPSLGSPAACAGLSAPKRRPELLLLGGPSVRMAGPRRYPSAIACWRPGRLTLLGSMSDSAPAASTKTTDAHRHASRPCHW